MHAIASINDLQEGSDRTVRIEADTDDDLWITIVAADGVTRVDRVCVPYTELNAAISLARDNPQEVEAEQQEAETK